MSFDLENKILKLLQELDNPITGKPIVNDTSKIIIKDGKITFSLNSTKDRIQEIENVRQEIISRISKLDGVNAVSIVITSEMKNPQPTTQPLKRAPIKGVKKVILVASGKGGVGKSTAAVNLAISLSKLGKKVGIVDVDIYGPSIPTLLGTNKKPILKDDMMEPILKFGLKAMSIGFLVNDNDALIWRGPMTTKMLYQLIRQTNWTHDGNELDYLIIDSPPGTGDVHLSLAENYKIDGVVIVTLPQALSTNDARKSLVMCEKLGLPVLGIIENMSKDSKTGLEIFGKSTVKKLAKEYKVPVLGDIPLFEDLAIASDLGQPITYSDTDAEVSKIYKSIAEKIL